MSQPGSSPRPSARERYLQPDSVIDGRYRIVRPLGSGATGVVYEAEQMATGQLVALKLIAPMHPDEEDMEMTTARFRREVQLIGKLSHPHIVRLLDVGQESARQLYMVLELVQGHTLRRYLDDHPDVGADTHKRLMLQVLEALSCAHDLGVVHRDLKPHNIMVTTTGARPNAKVLDFGIAALLQDARDPGYWTLTTTGNVVGTPSYMSPDQLRGQLSYGIDLYAWGLIFIECLTGRRAVSGDTAAHVIFLQLSETPIALPAALERHPLGAILARATAKDPEARYPSARELLEAVEACDVSDLPLLREGKSDEAVSGPETRADSPLAHASSQSVSAVQPSGVRCPHCDALLPARFKFCGACGKAIADALDTQSQRVPKQDGERRQLTVVWCGLANAKELHATLGPDELHELLSQYQARCREVVEAHGGKLVVYPGDGVLAYFGHPQAREDDARRAVAAGLAILDAVADLGAPLSRGVPLPELIAQVAVHTGRVVASASADQLSLVGPVVTIAESLKRCAAPGQLLASEATLELVRGFFVEGERTALSLEAVRGGLTAAPITGRTGARDRLEALDEQRLSPLVGRQQELDLLRARWRAVASGNGQVVLLTGDPGIGKSRVARALYDALEGEARWLDVRCTPESASTALGALGELLRELLGHDDPADAFRALGELCQRSRLGPYALPLIGRQLGIAPLAGPPPPLSPPRMRRELMESLAQLLLALSEEQPMVLLVEDLHWADPSTLDLIGALVDEVPGSTLLLLCTARPELQPPWQASHVTQLHLGPLGAAEIAELVRNVLGVREARELAEDIAARTDGVPLYVEELSRAMKDAAPSSRDPDAAPASTTQPIPTTLHASLMAGLDRVADAKRVAQVASVIGRHFDHELIAALVDADELERALPRLIAEGMLFRRGRGSHARYTFKHALLRDAAYQSLLKRTQRELHGRVAELLAKRPDTPPELTAHHWSEAGDAARAVRQWQLAAQHALESAAFAEVVHHAERGLEQCARLPDSHDKLGAELGLRATLGVPMMLMRGFAAPEVKAVYARAYELSLELGGGAPQMFPALWGLWMYYHVSGDYPRAQNMAELLLSLGETVGDSGMLVGAHQAMGATRFLRGDFAAGRYHFDSCLTLYDERAHRHLAFLFGQDAAVFAQTHASWIHCLEGDAARARACMDDALARCRRLGQPSSLGFALHFEAVIRLLLGEPETALGVADELIALSGEQGMAHWGALAQIDKGWAHDLLGRHAEGAEEIRAGVGMLQGIGSNVCLTMWLTALGNALLHAGDPQGARAQVDAAMRFVATSDEHFYDAALRDLEKQLLHG